MPTIELENLSKTFIDDDGSRIRAVQNIDLHIEEGEFFTLLGPSGCGKTTILRMLAGFENPTAGTIRVGGEDITDLPANRRDIGIVFQNYALFPHMSVFENIAYGLRVQNLSEPEIEARVEELLAMLQMEGYGDRKPSALSGGQQQRIAVARSLAPSPKILLMDEPLSNLDAKLREDTREQLISLHRELGIIIVYVTHDQDEALAISDRIMVLNNGIKQEVGTPFELYEKPTTTFVAEFLGNTNLLRGKKVASGRFRTGAGNELNFVENPLNLERGTLTIKPEDVLINPDTDDIDKENIFPAEVEVAQYLGERINFQLKLAGGDVVKAHEVPDRNLINLERGDDVKVGLPARDLRLIECE